MNITFLNDPDNLEPLIRETFGLLLNFDLDQVPIDLEIEFSGDPLPTMNEEVGAATATKITLLNGAPFWNVPVTAGRTREQKMLFFRETVIHELGHVLAFNLQEDSKAELTQIIGGAVDEWDEQTPWGERTAELAAELFKDTFLPQRHRLFPNRTELEFPIHRYSEIRAFWRKATLLGGDATAADSELAVDETVSLGHQPGSLTISPGGAFAYMVVESEKLVMVFNTATRTLVDLIDVDTTDIGRPQDSAITPDGAFLYVVHSTSNGASVISVIDTATGTVSDRISISTSLISGGVIEVAPDGEKVYLARAFSSSGSSSGNVSVIDTSTNTHIDTITTGDQARGLAITPDSSKVYASISPDDEVAVIDAASASIVGTIPVGTTPMHIAVTPDGSKAYVCNSGSDNLSVIDTATDQVVDTIPVGISPIFIAADPDGEWIYVDTDGIEVVEVASGTVDSQISFVSDHIDTSPDGATVYTVNKSGESITILEWTGEEADLVIAVNENFNSVENYEERWFEASSSHPGGDGSLPVLEPGNSRYRLSDWQTWPDAGSSFLSISDEDHRLDTPAIEAGLDIVYLTEFHIGGGGAGGQGFEMAPRSRVHDPDDPNDSYVDETMEFTQLYIDVDNQKIVMGEGNFGFFHGTALVEEVAMADIGVSHNQTIWVRAYWDLKEPVAEYEVPYELTMELFTTEPPGPTGGSPVFTVQREGYVINNPDNPFPYEIEYTYFWLSPIASADSSSFTGPTDYSLNYLRIWQEQPSTGATTLDLVAPEGESADDGHQRGSVHAPYPIR